MTAKVQNLSLIISLHLAPSFRLLPAPQPDLIFFPSSFIISKALLPLLSQKYQKVLARYHFLSLKARKFLESTTFCFKSWHRVCSGKNVHSKIGFHIKTAGYASNQKQAWIIGRQPPNNWALKITITWRGYLYVTTSVSNTNNARQNYQYILYTRPSSHVTSYRCTGENESHYQRPR